MIPKKLTVNGICEKTTDAIVGTLDSSIEYVLFSKRQDDGFSFDPERAAYTETDVKRIKKLFTWLFDGADTFPSGEIAFTFGSDEHNYVLTRKFATHSLTLKKDD